MAEKDGKPVTYLYHGLAFGNEHIIDVGISRFFLLQVNNAWCKDNLSLKSHNNCMSTDTMNISMTTNKQP